MSALAERVVRHLAIARQYVRIGWIRKSQFRWEFFNQVGMDLMFYATHLLVFEILYGLEQGARVPGWDLSEIRVFLGLVFVHDGFGMAFLGQGWHFGADLKKGNLDPLRVRPGQPAFLYFFQRFSPEGATNLLLGLAYLLWALADAGVGLGPTTLATLVWALALACWFETVLSVSWTIAEFYFTSSDLGRLFNMSLGIVGDRPLDVYGRTARRVLLYVLPVGALAWVPTLLLLGRYGVVAGAAYTLFSLCFGLGVFALWRRGFRRYESAMG